MTGPRPTDQYLAGFFDADGSVGFYSGIRAQISQVDPMILLYLKERFGGCISFLAPKKANKRAAWIWQITGDTAEMFLRTLMPHLCFKREQVRVCLAARRVPPGEERNALLDQDYILKNQDYSL